jgi:hypothetical protein
MVCGRVSGALCPRHPAVGFSIETGAVPGHAARRVDLPWSYPPRILAHQLDTQRARTKIEEIYQKLGDLVADGSLSSAVEHVNSLDQFKEAFKLKQSLKPNRCGKILFKFGASDAAVISRA